MRIKVNGVEVEVEGRHEVDGVRWRQPWRRGRPLGAPQASRARVKVWLDGPPASEVRTVAGDHDEAQIDGVLRRRVRVVVQLYPALVVVEWAR